MLIDKTLHEKIVNVLTDLNVLGRSYYVGGMVRDFVLGKKSNDIDIVIEKITEDDVKNLSNTFKLVGDDFPVFIFYEEDSNGNTFKIEIAVARKERSTGASYTDFEIEYGSDITLEIDLSRRDLTFNSMAVAVNDLDTIIDPFNGLEDLKNKVIRHTTDAFREDPLRVFRVARFAAKFHDFVVSESTIELMKELTEATKTIKSERIFLEVEKLFISAKRPSIFFKILRDSNNLEVWFPHIFKMVNLPHIHGDDVFNHTMEVIDVCKDVGLGIDGLFGALFHDVGKILTDSSQLPNHFDHDKKSDDVIDDISERLRVTNGIKKNIYDAIRFHVVLSKADQLRPSTLLRVVNILVKNGTIDNVINIVNIDRLTKEKDRISDHAHKLIRFAKYVNKLNVPIELQNSFAKKDGKKIAKIIEQWRVEEFKKLCQS